jgi:hypothetical protein
VLGKQPLDQGWLWIRGRHGDRVSSLPYKESRRLELATKTCASGCRWFRTSNPRSRLLGPDLGARLGEGRRYIPHTARNPEASALPASVPVPTRTTTGTPD